MNIRIILLILIAGFLNIFSISGAAHEMHFNDYVVWISPFVLCWAAYKTRYQKILPSWLQTVAVVITGIFLVLAISDYEPKAKQFLNMLTVFGIVLWAQLFTILKWKDVNLFKLGLTSGIFAIILINFFLPGNIWSGWSGNSAIGMLPMLMLGLCCVWCSEHRYKKIYAAILFLIPLWEVSQLENRSSLFSLLLLAMVTLSGFCIKKRKWFRVFYISLLLGNILIPVFNEMVSNMNLFKDVLDIGEEMTGKTSQDAAFNARDFLWASAFKYLDNHPFFGLAGVRPFYSHNFSTDVLMEFGLIGWILFMVMMVFVMEKSFKEGSRYNLFLIAVGCLVFMDTFENMLAGNDFFTIFTYCLPAAALSLNHSNSRNTLRRNCQRNI